MRLVRNCYGFTSVDVILVFSIIGCLFVMVEPIIQKVYHDDPCDRALIERVLENEGLTNIQISKNARAFNNCEDTAPYRYDVVATNKFGREIILYMCVSSYEKSATIHYQ